jgi:hypothetical protein
MVGTLVLPLGALVLSAWALAAPQDGAATESPATVVKELPRAGGKGWGGVHTARGVPRSFDHSGRYERLTGAVWMRVVKPGGWGPTANLEISVEKGTLRGYLALPLNRGYGYIEATPGHPARMTGDMVLLQHYRFLLEAVGGDAEGAAYRIWR